MVEATREKNKENIQTKNKMKENVMTWWVMWKKIKQYIILVSANENKENK